MAGDWIKVRHDLSDDPDMFEMSDMLGMESPTVVGHLVSFWGWMDRHTTDGKEINLPEVVIDTKVGVVGFASALRKVGWLEGENGQLELPKFERHNGLSAKARALEAEAKRIRRAGKKTNPKAVRQVSDKKPPKSQTRGEERRGDNNTSSIEEVCQGSKFNENDYKFAVNMFKKIHDVMPRSNEPNYKTWADEIRLFRERENVEHEEMWESFMWANNDPFWRKNIASPTKLRKHFPNISVQSKENPVVKPQQTEQDFIDSHTDRNWADGIEIGYQGDPERDPD